MAVCFDWSRSAALVLFPNHTRLGNEVGFDNCSLPEVAVSMMEVQKAWHLSCAVECTKNLGICTQLIKVDLQKCK